MAFKPFEFFRKREKLIVAMLTLVAMFLFIIGDAVTQSQQNASSGGGPGCGYRAAKWFGQGTYLANVDGDKVDEYDVISQSRRWHGLADYLSLVEMQGTMNLLDNILRFTPEQKQFLFVSTQVMSQQFRQALSLDMILQNFSLVEQGLQQMEQYIPNSRQTFLTIQQRLQDEIGQDKERLRKLSPAPESFPYQLAVHLNRMRMRGEDRKPETFVERPFWLHRARDLGIVVAPDRLKEDLLGLGRSLVSAGDLQALLKDRRMQGAGFRDLDSLLNFMSEETRVMMAKGILFYRHAGRIVQPTQFDVWQAYAKAFTELEVAIVPFNADNTGLVTTLSRQPTDEELKKLYTQYRAELPDATKPTPGFRVPEQFRLEFLLADVAENTPTGKHYQRLYELNKQTAPYATLLESAELYRDFLTQRETRYKRLVPFVVLNTGTKEKPRHVEVRHLWAQTDNPVLAAAVTAKLFAQTGPGFPALGLGSLAQVTITPAEADAKHQAIQLLAGFSGGLTGLLPTPRVGGIVESYTPFTQAYPDLLKEHQKQERAGYCQQDLANLQEDLRKYSPEYRKAFDKWRKGNRKTAFVPPLFKNTTVADYIDRFARERGLTYARMMDSRPQRTALYAPLEVNTPDENLAKQSNKSVTTLLRPIFKEQPYSFLHFFLGQQDPEVQRLMREQQRTGDDEPLQTWVMNFLLLQRTLQGQPTANERQVYEPDQLAAALMGMRLRPDKQVLHWKTEYVSERTPTFEESKDAVRAAWTTEQLRPLLEAKAKQVGDQAKGKPDGDRILRDQPGMKERIRLMRYQAMPGQKTLEPAPLPTQRRPVSDGESAFWQRMHGMVAQQAVLEHPPEDFIDQVMTNLKNPGDVLVLANQPKTTYYLVYLQRRQEPRLDNPGDLLRFNFDWHETYLSLRPQEVVTQATVSLRDYAVQEKARQYQEQWLTFIRKRTQYNTEMGDRVAKDLENMMQEGRRGG